MNFIMTQAGTLKVVGQPQPITGGAFIITSMPSTGVAVEDKPAFSGLLKYVFAGGSAPGFVPGSIVSVGEQTIIPTESKVLIDDEVVTKVGDRGLMMATGALTGGGNGPINALVEISSAGQESVAA